MDINQASALGGGMDINPASALGGGLSALGKGAQGIAAYRSYKSQASAAGQSINQIRKSLEVNKKARTVQGLQEKSEMTATSASKGLDITSIGAYLESSHLGQLADIKQMEEEANWQIKQLQAEQDAARKNANWSAIGTGFSMLGSLAGGAK